MTVKTYLVLETEDGQGYKEFVKVRIKDSAFGTGIPTEAKITAVSDALFGTVTPSTQILTGYSIQVVQDTPGSVLGSGSSPTAMAARTRNELFGADFPFSIPGLNESVVTFDPTNPNSISVVGTMWDDIRTALTDAAIAWSAPDGAYSAVSSDNTIQVATAFQGRRTPKRVR